MTEIMNFPLSPPAPAVPARVIAPSSPRCPGTSSHAHLPSPCLPVLPPQGTRTHARADVTRVEHLRSNLARLWKQFTSQHPSLPPSLLSLSLSLCLSLPSDSRTGVGRVTVNDDGNGATGWPETALEHCNSSNVSFMQNTC